MKKTDDWEICLVCNGYGFSDADAEHPCPRCTPPGCYRGHGWIRPNEEPSVEDRPSLTAGDIDALADDCYASMNLPDD